MAAATSIAAQQRGSQSPAERRTGHGPIKITDLKCAIIGRNPVIRIVTNQGVSGYGQAESSKPYLKPMVLFYKDYIVGEDPTDVQRVLLKIRRLGGSKPWGSAVSAIEMALWDIAGQVAGVPVYKLLGGKIRDRVRIYNGAVRFPMTGQTPQDYAENMAKMKEAKEGFTLIKQAVGFHNPAMMGAIPDMWYDEPRSGASHPNRGLMTERGLKHVIAFGAETGAQETADRRLVVDDQDAHYRTHAARSAVAAGTGSEIMNKAPRPSVRFPAVSVPPTLSMNPRLMARPRPVPARFLSDACTR